jgi:hypothetical protein
LKKKRSSVRNPTYSGAVGSILERIKSRLDDDLLPAWPQIAQVKLLFQPGVGFVTTRPGVLFLLGKSSGSRSGTINWPGD